MILRLQNGTKLKFSFFKKCIHEVLTYLCVESCSMPSSVSAGPCEGWSCVHSSVPPHGPGSVCSGFDSAVWWKWAWKLVFIINDMYQRWWASEVYMQALYIENMYQLMTSDALMGRFSLCWSSLRVAIYTWTIDLELCGSTYTWMFPKSNTTGLHSPWVAGLLMRRSHGCRDHL